MDDRWMRALLRPLDLLAFLSMTPVPSDARTPHPGRVPPARRPIPGRAPDGDWTVRWPRPPPARARSFNRPLSDGEGHPLGLRDYMERPAGVGHDTVDGETAGDGIVVVRDLDAQGDLRWKDVVADFLVHVSGGFVRWDAQDQASVVLCGPQVAVPFDFQSEAVTPVLGDDGDPLDHAAASFEGLRCHV